MATPLGWRSATAPAVRAMLFLDDSTDDYDPAVAGRATEQILAWLGGLSGLGGLGEGVQA